MGSNDAELKNTDLVHDAHAAAKRRHPMISIPAFGIVLALAIAACGSETPSNFVLETSSTTATTGQSATGPNSTTDTTIDVGADTSDTTAATGDDAVETTEPVDDDATTTTAPQAGQGTTLTDSARISTLGLGPVYMGDTLEEVSEKIGVALDPDEFGNDSCRYHVAPGGPPGVLFMVAFGRVARVDIIDPSAITTRSGAGIGSTKQEIVDLFGTKIVASPHPYTDGEYLTFVPTDEKDANLRIIFETNVDGVVTQFRTGQLPEIQFIEGCA